MTPPRVAVGLCGDLGEVADLIGGRLEGLPDVRVEVLRELCRLPELTVELASRADAERLVLGLCALPSGTHELQARSREAGLDPFAVERVNLSRFRPFPHGVEAAALAVAAAVARVRAFEGSRRGERKLRLFADGERLDRRSLFTLPPPTYQAVPSVAYDRCLGPRRCGLCLPACPVEAIAARGGRVVVDREGCESCGLCVTACPAAAIRYPGASLAQYEAELATLLSAGGFGLVFTCRSAAERNAPLPAGWLPVDVPCLAMITPGWLLQALAAGAPAVALAACGEDCRFGQAASLEEQVGYVRALLALLGEESPAERVSTSLGPPPSRRAGPSEAGAPRLVLSEPAATAEAALVLAESYGAAGDGFVGHDASPLGLVSLAEETCAACGSCASVCAPGALAFEEGADGAVVSFDATRCVACGRCAAVCPIEGTVTVRRVTDLAALSGGRQILKRDALVRCRRCGGPVAPAAMLNRILTILGPETPSLVEGVSELCADCRISGMYAAPTAGRGA